MCKNHFFNILIATSLFSTGSMALAADNDPVEPPVLVQGGAVHFKGEIVNAACAVGAESINQTINLGQYRTANFKAVGDKTGLVPFTIKLQDCDTAVATSAAVAFSGNADASDNSVLATSNIGGGASDAASGVGIEIADNKGKILAPNGGDFSTAQTLNDGSNVLYFTARYKATSTTVTPGQADADATFTMKYE
ncbi:type 1 fimbrial major subunit FimA [Serratia ureilytica]|uniref:type 1 fimbrial major subunit FimA n=1 Tax=Serratia ureilytica TaxID=300181 RepID=UPI001C10024C|nr:type 1 fimbrial major subunit FimA [Serratia ureilytica]MBU5412441.1 type 1 fimbrial major subunit FimA [Serratia ureilytica]